MVSGRQQTINIENGYHLNTLECDNFDNENIFWIYSIFNEDYFTYLFYYSFTNINNGDLNKNEIANNSAVHQY